MERTGLSGALVKLQARFVDWLIGRSLRKHFRAVYVRFAVPEVVDLPPSLRFPPLREGNREVGQAPPLREGNRAGSGETPLREGNREGRTRSVPPAGRGNLEEGVGIGGLSELGRPVILFANHHYWWDGYLGYWLIRAWGRRMVVWMESYRRFPPFGAIGALPFPPDDPMARARTVKRSVQALRTEPATALLLFPEGTLHGDTERLLPFQRSLHWLACRAPQATLLPLAIHIEPSYHQYPRAYLSVGAPFQSAATEPTDWLAEAAGAVETLLRQTRIDARAALTDEQHAARGFQVLLQGALSIHERF
jgi:1-acyl-sn-glycerol-3-phosphate acyltransferase